MPDRFATAAWVNPAAMRQSKSDNGDNRHLFHSFSRRV